MTSLAGRKDGARWYRGVVKVNQRLTSFVVGTTLTGWEMTPPMQVGAAVTAEADVRASESSAPMRIGHRKRLPHSTDESISGRVHGLAFDRSSLRTHRIF